MNAHCQDTRELTRRRKRSAQVNADAFMGKRDLLRMYEERGVENDYVRDLRRRVQHKRNELIYRGAECE